MRVRVLLEVPVTFDVGGEVIHAPMIEVDVGGTMTKLIVDTGSTDHVLTMELAQRAGLEATPGEAGTDSVGAAVPSWTLGEVPVRIGELDVRLQNVMAIAGPEPFEGWGVGGFLSPVHDARETILPAARRHDVGVILGTPLRQGLLARRHAAPERVMVADAERPPAERATLARRLLAIYDLAEEAGLPLPEMALRYLLSDEQISSVIPGARTAAEVRSNVHTALRGPLPKDLIERIESIG